MQKIPVNSSFRFSGLSFFIVVAEKALEAPQKENLKNVDLKSNNCK